MSGAAPGDGGRLGESWIDGCLDRYLGWPNMSYTEWRRATPSPAIIQQFPCENIYGHKGSTERALALPDGRMVRQEVKNQVTTGSVDEKFPYIMRNIEENAWREPWFVIVLLGDGARAGAEDWLEREAARLQGTTGKRIDVVRSHQGYELWAKSLASGIGWKKPKPRPRLDVLPLRGLA